MSVIKSSVDYDLISEKTGLHKLTIKRILTRNREGGNPRLDTMEKISHATGVDVNTLFFTEGKTPEQVLTA